MSLASKRYLEPEPRLGDAILHITCTKNGEHFIAEIYEKSEPYKIKDEATGEEREVFDLLPPRTLNAYDFIKKRFKHGYRELTRKGVTHPIFEIPITDYSIMLIQKAWTNKKVISEMAQPLFNKIYLREFLAEQNAQRTAKWREDGSIPEDEFSIKHDEWLKLQGIELNSYQKVASYNECKSKGYGLFAEPGLGKTAMMVRKMDHTIFKSDRQTLTLILCPKNIRTNWMNEINKFSMYGQRGLDKIIFIQLQGNNSTERFVNFLNSLKPAAADASKHIVVIAGYESYVQTEHLHQMEFDLCLLDEAHNIASPSTKRTKVLLQNKHKFHNKVIATGTPFRNTPFDIYTQLEFLGDGYSGFDSYKSFKDFYGVFTNPSQFNKIRHLEGFQNIPLLQEKLAKYSFIIRKDEALPYLPKKTFSIEECNLSLEQYNVYMAVATELYAKIESYGPDPDSLTVTNILTQMLRLAQITSGFAVLDPKEDEEKGQITRFDPNPKLERLIKYLLGDKEMETDGVLEDPNRKAIIWCCFKQNLKMIHERLKLEGIDSVMFHGSSDGKDEIVQKYNCDPKCRIFIGIAASGGVGLNLVGFDPYNADKYTTNTTDTIMYSSNWSMVNRMQAIDRAHRHNTRVPQHIVDMIVPGTIDMDIYTRLTMKSEMSISIQDIKHVLKGMIPQINGN